MKRLICTLFMASMPFLPINYASASALTTTGENNLELFARAIYTAVANNDCDYYINEVIPNLTIIDTYFSHRDSIKEEKKQRILAKESKRIEKAISDVPLQIANIRESAIKEGFNWDEVRYVGARALFRVDSRTNEFAQDIDIGETKNSEVFGVGGFRILLSDAKGMKYYIIVDDSACLSVDGEMRWFTYKEIKGSAY